MLPRNVFFISILCLMGIAASSQTHSSSSRQPTVISVSGKTLESLFQGLKPNHLSEFAQGRQFELLRGRLDDGSRPSHRARVQCAKIVEGACPSGPCVGHFNSFRSNVFGCSVGECNPVIDAYTDLEAPCANGTQDWECGDDSGVCCADAFYCPNPGGCN